MKRLVTGFLAVLLFAAPVFAAEVSLAQSATHAQDFKTADLVFEGTISGISMADIGLQQTPVPVLMFSFEKMKVLKGGRPKWSSFIFEHLPEGAAFSKGSQVVVYLRQSGTSEDFRIESMSKTTPEILSLLEIFSQPAVKKS